MLDVLIKNAEIYNANDTFRANIGIKDGKIISLSDSDSPAKQTIDAEGSIVLPAAIDSHTHMQLKIGGFTSSDTFATGTRAAVLGGTTGIGDFAYQEKGETLAEALDKRRAEIKDNACSVKLHIGITQLYEGIEQDIAQLVKNGNTTFKIHLNDPAADDLFLYRLYSIFSKYPQVTVLVHCEEGSIVEYNKRNFIAAGKKDVIYHPQTRPPFVEKFAVSKIINYANQFKVRTYIVHLSTKAALDFLRGNKTKYVFVETCPQYMLLTEDEYSEDEGFLYTCSPPFRTKIDNAALISGLTDDTIDTLATDHCPFWREDKEKWGGDFTKLPYGMPGVETLYMLALTIAARNNISINKVVQKAALNPAKIFGWHDRGEIKEGNAAEIVIFERKHNIISYKKLHMNCDFSPYEGYAADFDLKYVITGGQIYE